MSPTYFSKISEKYFEIAFNFNYSKNCILGNPQIL